MWKFLNQLFKRSDKIIPPPGLAISQPSRDSVAPLTPPRALTRAPVRKTFPNTFKTPERDTLQRLEIFDPALMHFQNAFRLSDPRIKDPLQLQQWHDARRRAMEHFLFVISQSPWKNHLILRGSMLLKTWLGQAAREPGDIDCVAFPSDMPHCMADQILPDLLQNIANTPFPVGVDFFTDLAAIDDIWLYARAPGRRMVIPWAAGQLPQGNVQIDIVFGEQLWTAPEQTQVTTTDGKAIPLLTASKEQSLAWKLQWLTADLYPQGKDLYDAVLLAEQTHLPYALLHRALTEAEYLVGPLKNGVITADFPLDWQIDWPNFKREYDWVQGGAEDWKLRLFQALKSTFEEGTPVPPDQS
jgi:hypothetical protein